MITLSVLYLTKEGELKEEVIVKRGEVITPEMAKKIVQAGIERIGIRSVLSHAKQKEAFARNVTACILQQAGWLKSARRSESLLPSRLVNLELSLLLEHSISVELQAVVVKRSEIHAEFDGTINLSQPSFY